MNISKDGLPKVLVYTVLTCIIVLSANLFISQVKNNTVAYDEGSQTAFAFDAASNISAVTNIASTTTNGKEIYIFVDNSTYNYLQDKINRLASDITSDLGARVIVQHSTYSSGPLEIRNILKQSYNRKVLVGSILIGSIPTFSNTGGLYTDWFYQDLDDDCPILSDGTFSSDPLLCNRLDSISRRDVFTGRISPAVNATSSVALIEKYLDKDHAYRMGTITFPKKLLVYPSVQILERNNGISVAENPLSANVASSIDSQSRYIPQNVDTIYETDYQKQRLEYLTKLKNNRYETAIINIHGAPDGQFPSQRYDASEITSADISKSTPNILYVALLSCSNGAFKSPNYLAGEFLFNGDTLLVTANSQEAAIGGFLQDPPIQAVYFQPMSFLNSSVFLGQMFIHDQSEYVTQIFGDPTLRIRGNPSVPQLVVSDDSADFGTTTNELKTKTISITNIGTSNVRILSLPTWGLTINGKSPFDPANPIQILSGRNFLGFNIVGKNPFDIVNLDPKQKIDISIQFSPATYRSDGSIVGGKYLNTYYLLTSDPTKPYIDFDLKAVVNNIASSATSAPVTITENGPGTVSAQLSGCSRPGGVLSGCWTAIPRSVVFTAQPSTGATFSGWGGACASAGSAINCSINITGPVTVVANFVTSTLDLGSKFPAQATSVCPAVGLTRSYTVPAFTYDVNIVAQTSITADDNLTINGTNAYTTTANTYCKEIGKSTVTNYVMNVIPAGTVIRKILKGTPITLTITDAVGINTVGAGTLKFVPVTTASLIDDQASLTASASQFKFNWGSIRRFFGF